MVASIRAIRDGGVTVLLTEHVMQAVMSLAEQVYVLNDGRIIAAGTPAEVVADPPWSRPISATAPPSVSRRGTHGRSSACLR